MVYRNLSRIMEKFSISVLSVVVVINMQSFGSFDSNVCEPTQYLELGRPGTLQCMFEDGFFGVFWYNSTDYRNDVPILLFKNFIRTGIGYTSGEYDVHKNGSLLINNVSLDHEIHFTVAYFYSQRDTAKYYDVEVIVVVKPLVPFPSIDGCNGFDEICFKLLSSGSYINCTLRDTRPNIPLVWIRKSAHGDVNINFSTTEFSIGEKYSSQISTPVELSDHSSCLALFVCKADNPPGLLERSTSMILVEDVSHGHNNRDPAITFIEKNSRIELNCTHEDFSFLVWKKKALHEKSFDSILLYAVFTEDRILQMNKSNVGVGINGSLTISKANVEHEGLYYCVYGNGIKSNAKLHRVVIFANPVPPYPVVEECNRQRDCFLSLKPIGKLTCTVRGVLPWVALEWKVLHENDASLISFLNQRLTTKNNLETFDVSLTASYQIHDFQKKTLKVQCTVPQNPMNPFHFSTEIGIVVVTDATTVATTNEDKTSNKSSLWWMILLLVPVILIPMIWYKVYHHKENQEQNCDLNSTNEENLPLVSSNLQGHTTIFKRELKAKYKLLYEAVQPIPYVKDRLYCVDRVFVEGGIEFLVPSDVFEAPNTWKRLESYQNIFNDSRVSSTRRFLEGDPGYGKSTITLQFAYDWCNEIPSSPLKDVDILIMLRLRQLGGVRSIYTAIKQFILPSDTKLNEDQVEVIIRASRTVVFILDGFDEYPDQEVGTASDVIKIIASSMFQEIDVLLTTRSFFLPKKFPPSTKRMRLTGFDDKARRYYIKKAVVGENNDGVELLEHHLEENPILSDLCQVPLLFVIFAHMAHESQRFRQLNSVTSFFRYMIACFHSHMRNKMEDDNVRKYDLHENEHRELDKIAFEALNAQNQKIVWDKGKFCQMLDKDFYDQYVSIGILVEEEGFDIIDNPNTPISEHAQYKTEVRFYHKLFCEWYAAHYLVEHLQANPSIVLEDFFQYLNIFDLQYVYRFACGFNFDCAKKVINYLLNTEGGIQFAILCIIEQAENFAKMEEIIRNLCVQGLVISSTDNLLLQRSSIQLLEAASDLQIPVREVHMHNCFKSVDFEQKAILTESRLALLSNLPIRVIEISLFNRNVSSQEVEDILKYSSMCRYLKELWLTGCVPPISFTVGPILYSIHSCNVDIKWRLFRTSPTYVLNLQAGHWEDEESKEQLTEEEYKNAVQKIETERKSHTQEGHKKAAERGRSRMRKWADENIAE